MTQPNPIRKVRKNPDFVATIRELDGLGIAWTLRPPIGKGHPYLEIASPTGVLLRRPISSSPRGCTNTGRVCGDLRRWLRSHGLIV